MPVVNPADLGQIIEDTVSGYNNLNKIPNQIESLENLNNDQKFLEGLGASLGIASIVVSYFKKTSLENMAPGVAVPGLKVSMANIIGKV